MKIPKFSILIPSYNGGSVVGETLKSIFSQDFADYEIIVSDDASADNTKEVIESFGDSRIRFFRNVENLGYPGNLEEARKHASGDIIFLMGQDDILGKDALLKTYQAFDKSDDIGAVTRPYYWFHENIDIAVRAKKQLNPDHDEVVRITDRKERVIRVFETLDQLSGLAFRKKFMNLPFHPDIFPCHVYPFASIFKKHPIVFLRDYNVAVRISTSQSRYVSSIYDKSPVESWAEMFNKVFFEDEFREIKKYCIKDFVAVNYIGLVQLRNYAKYRYLLREIGCLLKYRWENMFSFRFWFFSLGSMLMPPVILIPMVDWYKERINAKFVRQIKIDHIQ